MVRYTTVTKVRQSGGFVGNSNVTDAFISAQITRAQSYINSYISDVYSLPIGKYYTQTIVFSGTGSGSGTMTISIDGEDYDVAVTSSLTAAQAADLFRTAALSNDSFVTDGLGAGATVTIYSKESGDSTDVTISSTDPQTESGITATGGTLTEIAPPLIETLATEIAVAYLLITEYGVEAQDTDKDGFRRLSEWTTVLKNIAKKVEKIFDFTDTELARSNTKRLSAFPTASSQDADGRDVVDKIKMNDKF